MQWEFERPSLRQANYYANNFNDLTSGFVTCFELLLVNNWFIICDGFVVATDTKWTRIFFVAFYAICVLICLNVVVAFALDAFQDNAESLQTIEEEAPQLAPLNADEAPISDAPPDQPSRPGEGRSLHTSRT